MKTPCSCRRSVLTELADVPDSQGNLKLHLDPKENGHQRRQEVGQPDRKKRREEPIFSQSFAGRQDDIVSEKDPQARG